MNIILAVIAVYVLGCFMLQREFWGAAAAVVIAGLVWSNWGDAEGQPVIWLMAGFAVLYTTAGAIESWSKRRKQRKKLARMYLDSSDTQL